MQKMEFTDSHSHIHFCREFADVDDVIDRAEAAGVTRQVLVGCTPDDVLPGLDFLNKYREKKFRMTVGVHPHDSNLWNAQVKNRFKDLIMNEKRIVAIGEIGLDYYRNLQPQDVQKKAFIGQIGLAKELDVPVVIHVRDAWEEAIEILIKENVKKAVLHTFSGIRSQADRCWERGYYTSFSGVLTYPKNDDLREIAKSAPADRILIETDCPYLTPQIFRGKRNEPAFVVETAKELARVRGAGLAEIATSTTQNAITVFGLE